MKVLLQAIFHCKPRVGRDTGGGVRLGPGEVGVLPAARQVDPQRGPGPGRRQRGAKVRGAGPVPARLESHILTIIVCLR